MIDVQADHCPLELQLDRHQARHGAGPELFQLGSSWEASQLLENSSGILGWLAGAHPGEEVVEYPLVETGLPLGVTSLSCARSAAARHGFRQAVESYGRLATDRDQPELTERWFGAHLSWASAYAVDGDETGTQEVLQEFRQQVRRYRPAKAAAWEERAAELLAHARKVREEM
ncbi:hypothetical protein [Streptomyces sp. NPDC012756]|uniref:hypothetical protein n=1 Tax=Streptomyces sp. NPDC012756 TaxID=3364847 RepID=UPI00368248BE